MNALDVFCTQRMRDLFAIAKLLYIYMQLNEQNIQNEIRLFNI